jgi:hypothetical protein
MIAGALLKVKNCGVGAGGGAWRFDGNGGARGTPRSAVVAGIGFAFGGRVGNSCCPLECGCALVS